MNFKIYKKALSDYLDKYGTDSGFEAANRFIWCLTDINNQERFELYSYLVNELLKYFEMEMKKENDQRRISRTHI